MPISTLKIPYAKKVRLATFHGPFLLMAVMMLFSSACHSERPAFGKTAIDLHIELQTMIDSYSAALAQPMSKGDKERIGVALEKLHAPGEKKPVIDNYSITVLDSHGAMVAATAQRGLPPLRNYGNYQAVSLVAHKHKTVTSSLYLQGGDKLLIVCSPLLHRNRLAGILIIGIDADQLHQAGVSDNEFMSFTFPPKPDAGS